MERAAKAKVKAAAGTARGAGRKDAQALGEEAVALDVVARALPAPITSFHSLQRH